MRRGRRRGIRKDSKGVAIGVRVKSHRTRNRPGETNRPRMRTVSMKRRERPDEF